MHPLSNVLLEYKELSGSPLSTAIASAASKYYSLDKLFGAPGAKLEANIAGKFTRRFATLW